MKRFALYLGIAAGLAASCSIQEEDFKTPQQDDVIYYATFEQPTEEGTKVYANEDLLLRWTADDRVSIFNKITYNQEYRFIGETGDYEGGFNKVGDPEFITGKEIPHVVSVYPFQRWTRVTEDEVVLVTLPSVQSYARNSFGLGANTMVSVSSGNLLYYKNVGGYLAFRLYGEGVSISSITLRGNNGEKIAGNSSVTMPVDGSPSVEMASDATTTITLICETPVRLGATEAESTQFWFVVPPMTFSEGFTLSVNLSVGGNMNKSTSKSITIERNKLIKMSPMEVIPIAPEAVDLGLPSGLKWASSNLGASVPEEYGDYYAWGETEPYYNSKEPLIWKEDKETGYGFASYKWAKGTENTLTKYCTDPAFGYNDFTDGKTVLEPEDDAAHVNLGGKWRMPTKDEWTELIEKCSWTNAAVNDVEGKLVTGPNGNHIFLPAASKRVYTFIDKVGSYGFYWSSSLDTDYQTDAWHLYTVQSMKSIDFFQSYRSDGLPIRPILDDRIHPESISLNISSLSLNEMSERLTATVLPANTTDKRVLWSSSNPSVATVSSIGVVSGVSAGSAIITVMTVDGGKTASCNVTVSKETTPIPDVVDLGLPSGIKWASFNLKASAPEEYGDYYAWGETKPYYISLDPLVWKEGKESGYDWPSYKWCMGDFNTLTKYCTAPAYGYEGFIDHKRVLDPEDDAAYVSLGGKWRMPTDGEWTELREKCTWTWTSQNGVNGSLVTGPNGNSIFLPAGGEWYRTRNSDSGGTGSYWSSSSPVINSPHSARSVLYFSSDVVQNNRYRNFGLSIRPVYAE